MFKPFRPSVTVFAVLSLLSLPPLVVTGADAIDVGRRLELFVDDFLIADIQGDAKQHLILPEAQDVVFETEEPWEGNTSGYYSFFQDGDKYRMVYRGWQHDEAKKAVHPEVTCYAESTDGIHWVKPKLQLMEWQGSKANNIIWLGPGTHNFFAFRDLNPDAKPESRYKALGGIRGGLVPFYSPDCIHWTQVADKPIISNGAFDSQNLAFWDEDRKEYRAYWRYFGNNVRAIRTATSKDFLTWENEADLTYTVGTPTEHLYTNAVQKYFRAPHLFVGFPTRFEPQSQQVEPVLMTSRDGVHFHRSADPVIPRTAPKDRNHNRSNYMAWGMFPLPGRPHTIAVYGTENYYETTPGRVRLFTYRTDGFVALRGGSQGGTVTTKPLKTGGAKLQLNYVVRDGGSLTVEALDSTGALIGKSEPLTGDAVDGKVAWKQQQPNFSGAPVTLRFLLTNADVFAVQFQ